MIDMYNVFIVFMDTAMGLSGCTIRKKEQKESHCVTRTIQLLKIGTLHTKTQVSYHSKYKMRTN